VWQAWRVERAAWLLSFFEAVERHLHSAYEGTLATDEARRAITVATAPVPDQVRHTDCVSACPPHRMCI
jgi:hypothetical protein